MKVVCSYCRKHMGDKEPLDRDDVSHSMCEGCSAHFEPQWEGMTWTDYLDSIERPAAIVDSDGRLLACNAAAERMLGRKIQEMRGLLGGEFMECRWARLPEACGKTVHCPSCAIRRTVEETLATGQPRDRVPTVLSRLDESGPADLELVISTSLAADGMVRIVVENVK